MIYDICYYIYMYIYIYTPHHMISYPIMPYHTKSYHIISFHIVSYYIILYHIYIYIYHMYDISYTLYTIQYTISIYKLLYCIPTKDLNITQAWERVTTGGRAARGEKGTLALCPKPSHFFCRLMAVISGKPWSTPNEAMCIKDTYLHNNNQRKFS